MISTFLNSYAIIKCQTEGKKDMPTIRITEEHKRRLEKLAVQKTVEYQKVTKSSEVLEEILEKNLPKLDSQND